MNKEGKSSAHLCAAQICAADATLLIYDRVRLRMQRSAKETSRHRTRLDLECRVKGVSAMTSQPVANGYVCVVLSVATPFHCIVLR